LIISHKASFSFTGIAPQSDQVILHFFPHKNTAVITPFGKNAFRFNG
jgi:hypothetical protein